MTEYNPYEAPESHLEVEAARPDVYLAGRGARLIAALLDSLLLIAVGAPFWVPRGFRSSGAL